MRKPINRSGRGYSDSGSLISVEIKHPFCLGFIDSYFGEVGYVVWYNIIV